MIRHVRAADHPAVRIVLEAAFERADEADLVERLRADGDVVFELLAEEGDAVLGHILYSRLWADSVNLYAALAPLAVLPARHRTGLGASLMRASFEIAREFGVHGVLVLGDPTFYGRFGFAAEAARQVRAPYSGLAGFQGLALEPDAFAAPLNVAYPSAFAG